MTIYPKKFQVADIYGNPSSWPSTFIVQEQAKDYLRKVLIDGISFLKKYFDLTSEENLLRHLPTTYQWMDKGIANKGQMGSFYEGQDGIVHCLAAIILGDFDFVEKYASDDFKTLTPKAEIELQKILTALPELKRQYADTGKVV